MCRAQCVLVLALLVGLVQAWDIAVTAGDRIEFYTDAGTKTDTVRFNSQNLTALANDEIHNMLLYVDKQSDNDAICGYNMTSLDSKCYIQRNGRNIQGLAFDPVTEILFFTDTKERSINWFSFKPGSKNVFGNLLIKMDAGIPTDIAVDSCKQYIYWINTNLPTSTIERARFDGSDREVIVSAIYKLDLHSLAIDQQAQKIYWFMAVDSLNWHVYSADFNGENMQSLINFTHEPDNITAIDHPNSLTIRKYLFIMNWSKSSDPMRVFKFAKPISTYNNNVIFRVQTQNVGGIAANYKFKEHVQEISNCNNFFKGYETKQQQQNNSLQITREYEGPFCVHGVKDIGQSLCKCAPGYIGERCDVSICEMYCLQGNCSFTQEGLPECRCIAGYSGERCEVNLCHGYCLNNGTCSLNEEDEPVCECVEDYGGGRCEVLTGLNNANGSLNEKVEPVCQCVDSHEGSRLETDKNKAISTTSSYFLVEKNITLADLLENWSKRAH